ATTEAAQAKVALDKALAENVELKGKLEALAVSPDFVPVQMPADLPTDEAFQAELDAALTEYQTPKEGVDDATAFREYEKKRLDIQKRWIEADQTRKHITRENANRELAARSSVKSSINTWVAAQEPDLPIGWFWEVARRPDVINSVPAELTDPMARLDHQVKVALQICRAELNKIRGKAREAGAQAESINRAAGAVMPGGTSAAPASAAPPAPSGRKSFVDNVRSLAVQQPVQPS
ncbi:MAG TPA: hypothetical protein VEA38_26170, partial [Terriglobales bacterium]|nr:hypothetical protein [Terriglobales bacterium]